MVLRHSVSRFALVAFLGAAFASASTPLATHPTLTFFSSITEEPLARLEAESIGPRYVKHGPFQTPAPGVTVASPTLTLLDQPCSADDWAALLKGLGTWRGLPQSTDFVLTLPDDRAFVFLRPPATNQGALTGLVRPLGGDGAHSAKKDLWLLHIAHDDKSSLQIALRPLPARAAYSSEPAQAEPDAPSSPPDDKGAPSSANEPSTP